MQPELIFIFCLAGFAALAGFAISIAVVSRKPAALTRRLAEAADPSSQRSGRQAATDVISRIGRATDKAFESAKPEDRSALRRRLGYAGFQSSSAVQFYSGIRAVCLGAGLAGGYLLSLFLAHGSGLDPKATGEAVGFMLVLGYALPEIWLRMSIRRQQRALENGLPDALDLLVVCVESGLTIDAAMQRVGREISLAHPELSHELAITHMETQMGLPHTRAMRNFAVRTGCAAVQSLSAMLVQAERFGTSVGQALRVHADSLRIKRQYAAEERAAKAALKLTFPLVICIFPAMMIVLGGSAIVRLMETGFLGK